MPGSFDLSGVPDNAQDAVEDAVDSAEDLACAVVDAAGGEGCIVTEAAGFSCCGLVRVIPCSELLNP